MNNCVQDSDGDCVGANVLTDFDYVPGSDCESGECDATGVKRSEQIVESLIDIVIFIYIKDNCMQKAVRSKIVNDRIFWEYGKISSNFFFCTVHQYTYYLYNLQII